MSTVLITGGTGFIGSQVALRLARSGWTVRLLVRSPARLPAALRNLARVAWIEGDVTDPASMSRAVSGASAAVHCAGWPSNQDWG